MAIGQKVPMVLFPRFSSFNGEGVYVTTPIDMLGFGSAMITFWRGVLMGGGTPTVEFSVEQSADLNDWTELVAPFDDGENAEIVKGIGPGKRYIRGKVRLTADVTNVVGVTCWAVGYGERTEG